MLIEKMNVDLVWCSWSADGVSDVYDEIAHLLGIAASALVFIFGLSNGMGCIRIVSRLIAANKSAGYRFTPIISTDITRADNHNQ